MSMLDSFFNKGFRGSKCKTLLKLTIPRIKLLRNRRELQIKQMRKEIAKLLETGQEATARIRVEHIIREENMMAAQEIIELFCELISVRLPIIDTQRECPLDLKEAISSVCFAAPRCADLPELMQVQMAFASKYGKEFLAAATELMPDCGVNRQLIELLSIRAPPAEKKLKILKEIAEEHGVDWDPVASETELYKSHEDLLDGSALYVSGNKVPLPKEKHEEVYSVSSKVADEHYDSDPDLDSLEFPEVPTAILRPNAESSSTMEDASVPSAPHPELHQAPMKDFETFASPPSIGPEEDTSLVSNHETHRPPGARQFVPFSSPPLSSHFDSFKETDASFESVPRVKRETVDPSVQSLPKVKSENSEPLTQSLKVKPEISLDLQDVLLAAQAAAESAERAAAAARSAASLAQLRISELTSKKNVQSHDSDSLPDNPFGMENQSLSATEEMRHLDHQVSSADSDDSAKAAQSMYEHPGTSPLFSTESFSLPTYDDSSEALFKTSSFDESHELVNPQQLPQRMTSMEDDTLGSYPNLFGSGGHSFVENSRSNT